MPNADAGPSCGVVPELHARSGAEVLYHCDPGPSRGRTAAPKFMVTPKCKSPHSSIREEQHTDPTAGGVLRWKQWKGPPKSRYDPMWKNKTIFERANHLSNGQLSKGKQREFLEQDDTGVPWKTIRELDRDIDGLPHGPDWRVTHVELPDGEILDMYHRNAVDVVRMLIGTRRFRNYMRYAPVKHWIADKRVYGEMWSAKWWWQTQNTLGRGRGATVAPVILSCDQTQLSRMSGNRTAWPVYMTIGNISRSVRRRPSEHAVMLLGYIPVTELTGNEGRQFFHDCMRKMVASMIKAGKDGQEMLCADGGVRKVFPILAAFIADFAEQSLVASSIWSRCPICVVPAAERGDGSADYRTRTKVDWLDAWDSLEQGNSSTLNDLGLHPITPFWKSLACANISTAIAPDLLHQLHKGVVGDHLNKWLTRLIGEKRFDQLLVGLPRASGIRHFSRGKSVISQWTGKETKQLAKVLMPIIAGSHKPEVVKAARNMVDFMYRSHLAQLTEDDLTQLDADLLSFHDLKDAFRDSGLYTSKQGFKGIAKLHMLSHYGQSIRLLGAPDNFNTENTERLHIEYVKAGWRASNRVNEIPQMTKYLQRRESWILLRIYLSDIGILFPEAESSGFEKDRDETTGPLQEENDFVMDGGICEAVINPRKRKRGHDEAVHLGIKGGAWRHNLIWHPWPKISTGSDRVSTKRSAADLINSHGAQHLIQATRRFLQDYTGSKSLRPLHEKHQFAVWPRFRLEHGRVPFNPLDAAHKEAIRATPKQHDELKRITRYSTFDTVLFVSSPNLQGVHRYTAGRVRAIFKLPKHLHFLYPKKLVYVEHFQPFSVKPHPIHGMFTTSQRMERNNPLSRHASVMPLSKIRMGCHLTPAYTENDISDGITLASDLLDDYRRFYLNSYSSYFVFNLLDHWRKQLERGSS
ncbi:hypothetical protein RhiLY_08680 [Ceratobasidium sp. AG-Ba]|nr:hypothetical protein RhiLY_08680 [Ceratobasidium sp. AG-Ba]